MATENENPTEAETDPHLTADPIHQVMKAVYPPPEEVDPELADVMDEVADFLRDQPWTTEDERYFFLHSIAPAIIQLRRYTHPDFGRAHLQQLADLAWRQSEVEYSMGPIEPPKRGDDLVSVTMYAVLGILLLEPVILALRRCSLAARGQRLYGGLDMPPVRE